MACECSSTVLTCCSDNSSNFVQDKVCNPWSSAEASTFTVYANNVNQNIVGTGYLTYDVGPGVSPAEPNYSNGFRLRWRDNPNIPSK